MGKTVSSGPNGAFTGQTDAVFGPTSDFRLGAVLFTVLERPRLSRLVAQSLTRSFYGQSWHDTKPWKVGRRLPPLACESSDDAWFVVSCLHAAKVLRLDPGSCLEELNSLGRRINSQLSEKYTAEERRRFATGGRPSLKDAFSYLLIRRLHPETVVETGVAQGISSCFILSALERNRRGHLISIDLPSRDPAGRVVHENGKSLVDRTFVRQGLEVGWLVPADLRSRWSLVLEDSRTYLSRENRPVDIFLHDSLHSYEHMNFEFEWAWRNLNSGGFLLSDDVGQNDAYSEFIVRHRSEIGFRGLGRVGVAWKLATQVEGADSARDLSSGDAYGGIRRRGP